MSTLIQDVRHALRVWRKDPGFALVAAFTLALGIGANTAIFSVVNATLLQTLPYAEPHRLVHLAERSARGSGTIPVSYPNFRDWERRQSVFSALAFVKGTDGRLRTASGTEVVSVENVSAGFFDVLGVQPALGRGLRPEDDRPGSARVVWLTWDAWQRLLGGAADVVGRSLTLDGRDVAVAGVLPRGFRFFRNVDLVMPVGPLSAELFLDTRESRSGSEVVARLGPGVDLGTARGQMDTIARTLAEEYPAANEGTGIATVLLRERLAGDRRREILLLLGAVGLVLLIACVNVANMLLGRSLARRREMAIRASLGASRVRLGRQLVVESLVLAFIGGGAGALGGWWGYRLLVRLVPGSIQRVLDTGSFDGRVLGFCLAITVFAGLAFGLVPAWQLSMSRPVEALKQKGSAMRLHLGRVSVGELLVAGQVALALVLLVGAGLMIRSLARLVDVKTGYDPSRVLTLELASPPIAQFQRDPQSFTRHFEKVLDPARRLPEVEAVAVVSGLPFSFSSNTMTFYHQDRPVPAAGEFPAASQHTVSPDYFRAMGIPLLRGRAFDGSEPPPRLPEGITITDENLATVFEGVTFSGVISQKMAERFWPGEDPIGRRFRLGFPRMGLPWVEIIGIVGNTVQRGLDQGQVAEFYLPLRQWPVPVDMHLVARTRTEPRSAASAVRAAVASVLPDDPPRDIQVLAERIEASTAGRRFNRNLFAGFAFSALVLALVGAYGVLALQVGQRSREIGIRMALGAHPGVVMRSIVGRAAALGIGGLAVGLAGAWGTGRALESQLFGVTGKDPLTYATGAVLMFMVTVLAAWLPARRAARVDPQVALRCE